MSVKYLSVSIPEIGELKEIIPGIFWLRMPLPFDLDHINLYLIDDGDAGYALIDTGISTAKVESLWNDICSRLDKPISKVIVTHLHPDHIGMAGFLVEKFRVPFYMSHAEYFTARALSAGPRGASDWQDDEYLAMCGMSEEYIGKAKARRSSSPGLSQVIRPIPIQFERLQAADLLQIGNSSWRVHIGRGHSPEHVCLYNEETKILISGDHVLPGISPNIGVYSTEPNANTLKMYLETLPPFLNLPADTLVLPSHKQPFYGLHQRINELMSHHKAHLKNLTEFCESGKTIQSCLKVLFKRDLNEHNMFFAIAEAFSHLNYLYFEGYCSRDKNEHGQYIFTSIKQF